MRNLVWLILPCFLAACASASTGTGAQQTAAAGLMFTQPPGFGETKMFQLTAEMLTRTAVAPKNDATLTAILAIKYAGGTAMAATMTAVPTPSLTPTIPPDSPPCRSVDLHAKYLGAMGATQSLLIGMGVTNDGVSPCFLRRRPQAALVDAQGRPLDIQYTFSPNEDMPSDPQATLGLPPGRSADFSLQWGNWCLAPGPQGISIRLILADGRDQLNVPTDLSDGPACNDPGHTSWAGIFPFELR